MAESTSPRPLLLTNPAIDQAFVLVRSAYCLVSHNASLRLCVLRPFFADDRPRQARFWCVVSGFKGTHAAAWPVAGALQSLMA